MARKHLCSSSNNNASRLYRNKSSETATAPEPKWTKRSRHFGTLVRQFSEQPQHTHTESDISSGYNSASRYPGAARLHRQRVSVTERHSSAEKGADVDNNDDDDGDNSSGKNNNITTSAGRHGGANRCPATATEAVVVVRSHRRQRLPLTAAEKTETNEDGRADRRKRRRTEQSKLDMILEPVIAATLSLAYNNVYACPSGCNCYSRRGISRET